MKGKMLFQVCIREGTENGLATRKESFGYCSDYDKYYCTIDYMGERHIALFDNISDAWNVFRGGLSQIAIKETMNIVDGSYEWKVDGRWVEHRIEATCDVCEWRDKQGRYLSKVEEYTSWTPGMRNYRNALVCLFNLIETLKRIYKDRVTEYEEEIYED